MAPIEDSLRNLLVDIVRRCQSTVAQNYQHIQSTQATSSSGPVHLPTEDEDMRHPIVDDLPLQGGIQYGLYSDWFGVVPQSSGESTSLNAEASTSAPIPSPEQDSLSRSRSEQSDSGYSSQGQKCQCLCHLNPHLMPGPHSKSHNDHKAAISLISLVLTAKNCAHCSSNDVDIGDDPLDIDADIFDFDHYTGEQSSLNTS